MYRYFDSMLWEGIVDRVSVLYPIEAGIAAHANVSLLFSSHVCFSIGVFCRSFATFWRRYSYMYMYLLEALFCPSTRRDGKSSKGRSQSGGGNSTRQVELDRTSSRTKDAILPFISTPGAWLTCFLYGVSHVCVERMMRQVHGISPLGVCT